MSRRGNKPGELIGTGDRASLMRTLNESAAAGNPVAIRDRALLSLALGSALRVSECIRLEVRQVLVHEESARVEIRAQSYLYKHQAKGGHGAPFVIPRRARAELGKWVRYMRRHGWGGHDGPLFVTTKRTTKQQHVRLSKRGAQRNFKQWLRRAGVSTRFSFHDLRHTATTVFAGRTPEALEVARFARHLDLSHSLRYVHRSGVIQNAEDM